MFSRHSCRRHSPDRLAHYELRDIAIKVVGIGSVGTACWVALFMSGNNDPLFLQIKEARASVLEPYAGPSKLPNHGQRVVNGYRILQPFSDVILGWTAGPKGRHYFFRQLRDIKISARVETFGRLEMDCYSDWCGKALALSHARYGHSAVASGIWARAMRSTRRSLPLQLLTPTKTKVITPYSSAQSEKDQ